jgi:hypothetical protein
MKLLNFSASAKLNKHNVLFSLMFFAKQKKRNSAAQKRERGRQKRDSEKENF